MVLSAVWYIYQWIPAIPRPRLHQSSCLLLPFFQITRSLSGSHNHIFLLLLPGLALSLLPYLKLSLNATNLQTVTHETLSKYHFDSYLRGATARRAQCGDCLRAIFKFLIFYLPSNPLIPAHSPTPENSHAVGRVPGPPVERFEVVVPPCPPPHPDDAAQIIATMIRNTITQIHHQVHHAAAAGLF